MTKLENYGQFIRRKRIEKQISLRSFANSIGVSFSHWSDIEMGKKNPPKGELLEKISLCLEMSDEDKNTMYTLAGICRNTLAPDVIDYVLDNIYLNDILRFARDNQLSQSDWNEFFEFINMKKG